MYLLHRVGILILFIDTLLLYVHTINRVNQLFLSVLKTIIVTYSLEA